MSPEQGTQANLGEGQYGADNPVAQQSSTQASRRVSQTQRQGVPIRTQHEPAVGAPQGQPRLSAVEPDGWGQMSPHDDLLIDPRINEEWNMERMQNTGRVANLPELEGADAHNAANSHVGAIGGSYSPANASAPRSNDRVRRDEHELPGALYPPSYGPASTIPAAYPRRPNPPAQPVPRPAYGQNLGHLGQAVPGMANNPGRQNTGGLQNPTNLGYGFGGPQSGFGEHGGFGQGPSGSQGGMGHNTSRPQQNLMANNQAFITAPDVDDQALFLHKFGINNWPSQNMDLATIGRPNNNEGFNDQQLNQLHQVFAMLHEKREKIVDGHSLVPWSAFNGGFNDVQLGQIRSLLTTLGQNEPLGDPVFPVYAPSPANQAHETGMGLRALKNTHLAPKIPHPETLNPDELARRLHHLTLLGKAALMDPNFKGAPRSKRGTRGNEFGQEAEVAETGGNLTPAQKKANERRNNRLAAERKRYREAMHRDQCVSLISQMDVERKYWKAWAVACGVDPASYDTLPEDVLARMRVPVETTVERVGAKKRGREEGDEGDQDSSRPRLTGDDAQGAGEGGDDAGRPGPGGAGGVGATGNIQPGAV